MTSAALRTWKTESRQALDEIVAAHVAIGGEGPGRRYATRELNHAYAVLLSAQFQRYCRDLHTESVDHIVNGLSSSAELQEVVRTNLLTGRKLVRGNPNAGALGSDFNRLGLDFWHEVRSRNPKNKQRQKKLESLMAWRNAIAHQDFTSKLDPPPPLWLDTVKQWRSACNTLAAEFDKVLGNHLAGLVQVRPW